ncbi:MAG: hypothetical protein WCB47_01475, partial [Pseudolabrys sp.]
MKQGILAEEQGISSAKPISSPREVFGTHGRDAAMTMGSFVTGNMDYIRRPFVANIKPGHRV